MSPCLARDHKFWHKACNNQVKEVGKRTASGRAWSGMTAEGRITIPPSQPVAEVMEWKWFQGGIAGARMPHL
ncbi:MAG: hypothetical protein B0D91_03750 [Oceanospirillales bacterium LUC14_002_19_P2]|nr:MAG: hypothetical protein B0D91_03750 [Oceanospirillales bacterium LUC14_002_19_P2]